MKIISMLMVVISIGATMSCEQSHVKSHPAAGNKLKGIMLTQGMQSNIAGFSMPMAASIYISVMIESNTGVKL